MAFFKTMRDFAGVTRSNLSDGACGFYNRELNLFQAKDNDGNPIPFDTAGTTDLKIDNVVLVSKNGNDATGEVGNLSKPFLTVLAASLAASDGNWIHISSGNYAESNSPFKTNKNYFMERGAKVLTTGNTVSTTAPSQKIVIRGYGELISSGGTAINLVGNNSIIDIECYRIDGNVNCIEAQDFDGLLRIRAIELNVNVQYLLRVDDAPLFDIEVETIDAINSLGASAIRMDFYGVDDARRYNYIKATTFKNNGSGLFPAIFNIFGGRGGVFYIDVADFQYTGTVAIAQNDGNQYSFTGNYQSTARGFDMFNLSTTIFRLVNAYVNCRSHCVGIAATLGYMEIIDSTLVTNNTGARVINTPTGAFFANAGYLDIRNSYIVNQGGAITDYGIYMNFTELRLDHVKIISDKDSGPFSIFAPVAKNILVETIVGATNSFNANVTEIAGGTVNINNNINVIPLFING